MSLKVLVIDRAPPVSLRQGNALIGLEVFSRLSHLELTLIAPATPEEHALAPGVLASFFRDIHLVPRARWTPALTGSVESRLAGRLPRVPWLDLRAANELALRIRAIGRERRFDIVHVRQLPMAGYGSLLSGQGSLLELIDSETLGAERALPRSARTRLRARMAAHAERRAMRPFDVVTTVAGADAARLRLLSPSTRVEVVPNGVDAERFAPDPHLIPPPASLVFVGAMSYPPNVAAMRYFTSEVLPIVRRSRSDVRLTIVGRDPALEVLGLASVDVEVTGEVDDVRPYLGTATIFVAPMVSGSGIKNKVLEAMAMARPVVATPLAVEGLPVTHGEDVLVADSPVTLAAAILTLLRRAEERESLGRAGRAFVEARYTWARCAERYEGLYDELARKGDRVRSRS